MTEICQAPHDPPYEFTDDPTIHDQDELWRVINPSCWGVDEKLGRVRPTSDSFLDSKGSSPMSVVLAKKHSNPEAFLEGFRRGSTLVSITASLARELCQGVARDPTLENPAHALVFGKKTGRVRSNFAKRAEWVVPPPPP